MHDNDSFASLMIRPSIHKSANQRCSSIPIASPLKSHKSFIVSCSPKKLRPLVQPLEKDAIADLQSGEPSDQHVIPASDLSRFVYVCRKLLCMLLRQRSEVQGPRSVVRVEGELIMEQDIRFFQGNQHLTMTWP